MLVTVDLVEGGWHPYIVTVDPDDSEFRVQHWTGDSSGVDFHDSPILRVDGTTSAAPAGAFAGYVPGPLAESWPAAETPGS